VTASFIKPKMKYYLEARMTNFYFKVLKFLKLKKFTLYRHIEFIT